MKIAIPLFGPRISPRFDCAPLFLLVTVENGDIVERSEISLQFWNPWQRVEAIKDLGIRALICGGIDEESARMLRRHRIRVIPWVAGEVEETLRTYLKGELESGSVRFSGHGRKGQGWRKQFCPKNRKISKGG
ncbi:MAG: dinitrogenase iron-molybdenum cofactor biosynthesis protein [Deltaproteobacteria bacterium]|nr:dinitrogenase iron-molybdenum cofactor biosynthesis protein [Deltaproteobacteria bacterium]